VLFLWLSPEPGWAQPLASPDDYVVQTWDTDAGLPDSTVTSLAQTPDGYLWIGTLHGGLARFNGTSFQNFTPANTPQLKSIEIHQLLVDGNGTLWIGNVEGGLISYRDGIFRFEYGNAQTPDSWVKSTLNGSTNSGEFASVFGWVFRWFQTAATNQWHVFIPADTSSAPMTCEDHDGTIWYRLKNGGLAQLRGTNVVQLNAVSGLRGAQVNTLLTDPSGRVWVGTEKELAVWNGNSFVDMTPTNGPPNLTVNQIVAGTDGSLWVWTNDQLRKCANRCWLGGADPFRYNTNSSGSLLADAQGGVWIFQHGEGLWHISADGQASRVTPLEGLPNNLMHCWLLDREGNLWLGFTDGGLACVRPRIFHTVWPNGPKQGKSAHSACEDNQGAIWFGTAGPEVLRWQNETFSIFTVPDASLAQESSVLPATHGLWVGTVGDGLLLLTNGIFTRPFPAQSIGTVVRCLLQDHTGALWIGNEFGLFRWFQGGLKHFSKVDGFTPAYVEALAEDRAGDLWLGTALGELRRYHDGQFETFLPKDSRTAPDALAAAAAANPMEARGRGTLTGGERFWELHFDDHGVMWIGSLGGGLLRFQNGQFTRFGTPNGLPNENVSQILEDDRGQLWLGLRNCIARIGLQTLDAFASNHTSALNFVTYGKFDGLPSLQCSGGNQPNCWRGQDGRLWFTTVKGAVWVNPAEMQYHPNYPPVELEEVWVDNRQMHQPGLAPDQPGIGPPAALRISPGQHYFEFKFSALSFTSPGEAKFKWRINGLEPDWSPPSERHAVSYTFIPPGQYHFEVTACNGDGIWNPNPASVEITVLPYFWQRWWFRLAVGGFLLAVAFAIYSIRIGRLRALERLRLRIARDLHDEVGSNLGTISLLAQMMEQTPSSADATQVRGIAVQTIDTLRDIVWFIDPKHDRLSDLVARLRETAGVMLASVPHRFTQEGNFESADLSLAFRRNVPPLFKETLHNILKHAHATEVEIVMQRQNDRFEFRIRDNGVGFDPARKSSGNGLRNLRKRAAEIGGSMEISSSPGAGTTVIFSAPITQTRDWFKSVK
jgi:ligand-binding sensor domain-containing protein